MIRPKILVCVDWFFPGYKAGGPIQSCRNFVAAMEEAYEIYILSSDRDLGDLQPYDSIRPGEWNGYSRFAKVYYAPVPEINAAFLEKLVKEINPDFIYLNSMYSFRFTILPLWLMFRKKISAKLVLAPRGMLQAGAMQFKPAKKKLFIRLIKLAGLEKSIHFHATDEQEKKDIQQYFPKTQAPVMASNFPAADNTAFLPASKQPNDLKLAYISRLAEKKNIHFILNLLAKMPKTIQCELNLRGEFEDETYRLKCETIIKDLPANITVRLGGAINNDHITSFLQQYHIFVLPTLGENFGHAIFEALSAGRPVLISDKTPWRNLVPQKAGWDIALDQPELFTSVLLAAAAMDENDLNEWCMGAWQLADNFRKNSNIKQQYKQLFY